MVWEQLKETDWYKSELLRVQGICELFYDQESFDPFKMQIAKQFQTVEFDFPHNINAKINYLVDLLASGPVNMETKYNVWRGLKILIDFQQAVYHELDPSTCDYADLAVGPDGISVYK